MEDGRALQLGWGRQRALLPLLLLRANQVVAQDRLVDELWGESPPPTAPTASHVPRARLAVLDAGHEIPLEQPRELAALIEAFLAGLATM